MHRCDSSSSSLNPSSSDHLGVFRLPLSLSLILILILIMRLLLLSLRRVTPLSRHQRYAFAPIHNCFISINPSSPSSSLVFSAYSFCSSPHSNGDGKIAGPLVEYERRIVAGELLDGDLCQVLSFSFFCLFPSLV